LGMEARVPFGQLAALSNSPAQESESRFALTEKMVFVNVGA
jgi:hypothetical protein